MSWPFAHFPVATNTDRDKLCRVLLNMASAADIANAFRDVQRDVRYKRYKPEQEFDNWLSGFVEAVANTLRGADENAVKGGCS